MKKTNLAKNGEKKRRKKKETPPPMRAATVEAILDMRDVNQKGDFVKFCEENKEWNEERDRRESQKGRSSGLKRS